MLLLCFSGGTMGMMKGAGYLDDLGTATLAQKLWALLAVGWFIAMIIVAWKLNRIYRRGQSVAVTSDGLIVRMVGFKEELMPWTDIRKASVKDVPEKKPQVALLRLKQSAKVLPIGGIYNVFPTRAHVERFVAQVNRRVEG